jgi:transcriptional regulator
MYLPTHFEETSIEEIKHLIEEFALSVLVVNTSEGLVANHIPLMLLNQNVLIGHIAYNNDLHRNFIKNDDVLAVFRGEDAYISPNWYPSKKIHHKHVPTWNYQVAHVNGKITFQHDKKTKISIVGKLTKHYEKKVNGPNGWKMADAPKEYMEAMLDSIVAFKIDISKVTGKSKLSQNREKQDFDNVANILEKNGKHTLSKRMKKIKDTKA